MLLFLLQAGFWGPGMKGEKWGWTIILGDPLAKVWLDLRLCWPNILILREEMLLREAQLNWKLRLLPGHFQFWYPWVNRLKSESAGQDDSSRLAGGNRTVSSQCKKVYPEQKIHYGISWWHGILWLRSVGNYNSKQARWQMTHSL